MAKPWALIATALFFSVCASPLRAVPLPEPRDPAARWRQVRSLGKMWQWHTLLAVSPDGEKLVFGGYSSTLVVYDLARGRVEHVVKLKESVQDAAFSPDGRVLAVAEWRDGFTLRDARTLKVIETFFGSARLSAWQVRFSKDGNRLICYSWWGQDTQFHAYDLEARKEIGWAAGKNVDTQATMMRERIRGFGNHLLSVERARGDGGGYYTGHTIWVTDPATGKVGPKTALGEKDYFQFDISPDGRQVIVMRPGEDARVVEVHTGKTLRTLDGHRRWMSCAAFSPDGKMIATASGTSEDGHARIYTTKYGPRDAPTEILLRDAATGETIARLDDLKAERDFAHLGFSPDGQYVYAMTYTKELILWGRLPSLPADFQPLPHFDSPTKKTIPGLYSLPKSFERVSGLLGAVARPKAADEKKIEAMYLTFVGRLPTPLERNRVMARSDRDATMSKMLEAVVAWPGTEREVDRFWKMAPLNWAIPAPGFGWPAGSKK